MIVSFLIISFASDIEDSGMGDPVELLWLYCNVCLIAILL
jgi:hypothetical protein